MYAAPDIWLPPGAFIGFGSKESLGPIAISASKSLASATWAAVNRTYYVPVRPSMSLLVKRMFVFSGATVGTDTVTVALYSSDTSGLPATRLVSASATAANANACQYFNITDTSLFAGRLYYMAVASSGTTATVSRSAANLNSLSTLTFVDASNCPDPAVPAIPATSFLPCFGLDLRGAP